MLPATKDPVKVRAGQIGARIRWGDEPRVPRTISLASLTAAQRRLVVAMVDAARAEGAAATGQPLVVRDRD